MRCSLLLLLSMNAVLCSPPSLTGAPEIDFERAEERLSISIGDSPFAEYVLSDPDIPRPHFCDVRTPSGIQVTRNHPPVKGEDLDDHPTFHPGIWTAFGDLSGADFWRLKAEVAHERFVEEPARGEGEASFAVENVYREGEREVCREVCHYRIAAVPAPGGSGGSPAILGYLLIQNSEFFNDHANFVLGDQEEMGLGVRFASGISVKRGGEMVDSEGHRNEEEAWGKIAQWCDGSGVVDGTRIGMTVIPHPNNFRPCWFHARDYGLIIANPFGRKAYTGGEPSAVTVEKGERFRLGYGVFAYSTSDTDFKDSPSVGYRAYLEEVGAEN
jgi:hypothetical protein